MSVHALKSARHANSSDMVLELPKALRDLLTTVTVAKRGKPFDKEPVNYLKSVVEGIRNPNSLQSWCLDLEDAERVQELLPALDDILRSSEVQEFSVVEIETLEVKIQDAIISADNNKNYFNPVIPDVVRRKEIELADKFEDMVGVNN